MTDQDEKPLTAQDVAWLRIRPEEHSVRNERWIATIDAKDAEIAELRKQVETLRTRLTALANAADQVVIKHFDTDMAADSVCEMQSQTLAAREALKSTAPKGETGS